jgi:hypothetical protein
VNVAVSWTPLCLSDSRALPGWEAIHLLQKIQKKWAAFSSLQQVDRNP